MTATVAEIAGAVADPELPVVTIAELGILRDASGAGRRASVTITPTYSGCPAMDVIRNDIAAALRSRGYIDIEIHTVFAPPWTTDWVTESGKAKLQAAGIAPPGAMGEQSAPERAVPSGAATARAVPDHVATSPNGQSVSNQPAAPRRRLPLLDPSPPSCPRCRAVTVEEISRFGPTACTSLWRCLACAEPFEHMKVH